MADQKRGAELSFSELQERRLENRLKRAVELFELKAPKSVLAAEIGL
ncbi:MAG: hypothetical protein HY435_00955 [Candidatus Liptonbacteria bacterium]|nr:hypothetical protein [Candidatus Liptonbacteria bacterium]